MKTRKTLKKKRTSKKNNKTQFRRFNKHSNLTSKIKGGGVFDIFKRYPAEYYSTWITNLEGLKTNIENDTTYTWLYTDALRTTRLEFIDTALKQFREKNIEETYKTVSANLIKTYNDRTIDSESNTDKIQQIENATNLLSRLYEDRLDSKNWLEKYITHLMSDNSGLSAFEKLLVQKKLQSITTADAMDSEQVYNKWKTMEPERNTAIVMRQRATIAEQQTEQKAEQQTEQKAEQKAEPTNSSILSKTLQQFTSRFQRSEVPPVVPRQMPRIGARPKPQTVPPFSYLGSPVDTREAMEKIMDGRNVAQEIRQKHQQNGGKSKHTVKINVKSKKRRR